MLNSCSWWVSEDGRKDSPLLSVPEWNKLLLRNGFQGIEISTPDHLGPNPLTSMIISKATVKQEDEQQYFPSKIAILGEYNSAFTNGLSEKLASLLGEKGSIVQQSTLESLAVDPAVTYIVLDCAEHALLIDPSPKIFGAIQDLLTKGQNILWMGFQESVAPQATASKALITGMARVLRRENESARLATLDVKDIAAHVSPAEIANSLMQIAVSSLWSAEHGGSSDREYSYKKGSVSVARLQIDIKFNKWADGMLARNSAQVERCAYHDFARPLKLITQTPSLLSSLRFVDDPKPSQELGPDEIQAEAYAHGINFNDVLVALGQAPPKTTMIGEFAGIITAVGTHVKEMHKVGDRVAGLYADPYASHPRVKGLECQKLPDSLSFTDGASAVTLFLTAWYCLDFSARLQKGQSILIHAASGDVGQAAIQMAQHIGAEIFVTVGSMSEGKVVMDKYNIPESHIFSSQSTTFKQGILRLTKHKGVDVVLNSLSREMLTSSLECIAPFGTLVELGKTDSTKPRNINMAATSNGVTLAIVDIALLGKARPDIIRNGLKQIFDMFEQGILHTVYQVTTFPMDQVEHAFRLIAARKRSGKVVMIADKQTKVEAAPLKPSRLLLDGDGTYVVAGGLGDVGRAICRLLAARGAGYIVTLSRRTLEDEDLKSFKQEIEQCGSKLHVLQCDITDEISLLNVKKFCSNCLPRVKGVIQGGMVLRVRAFTSF